MVSLASKIDLVKQYLDVRVAEHSLHAGNIANAETPNYQARVGNFEAKLQKAQEAPTQDPMTLLAPGDHWDLNLRVSQSKAVPREDGNNVNLEQEMASMAENSLLYMTALKIFNRETAIASYAITSGGR